MLITAVKARKGEREMEAGKITSRDPARAAGAVARRCAKPHAVSRSSTTRL
jgi:hypothetical protein